MTQQLKLNIIMARRLETNMIKEKTKKLINSFKYAFSGIIASFKTERNMKIHILIAVLVIVLGILLKMSKTEWVMCIFAITIVISAELFNTAIETIVDMITTEKNEKAKIAKDVSAGGVLLTAIGAAIVGLIIFIPKILELI